MTRAAQSEVLFPAVGQCLNLQLPNLRKDLAGTLKSRYYPFSQN